MSHLKGNTKEGAEWIVCDMRRDEDATISHQPLVFYRSGSTVVSMLHWLARGRKRERERERERERRAE